MIFGSVIGAPSAWADSKLDQLCNSAAMAGNYGSSNMTQAQQYCQAGKAAEDSASADNKVWMIYAAASAICTAQCVLSMSPESAALQGMYKYICTAVDLGAAGAGALWTKNYMTALTSVLPQAEPLVANAIGFGTGSGSASTGGSNNVFSTSQLVAHQGGTAASGGGAWGMGKADTTACMTAATLAYGAFTTNSDAGKAQSTVNQSVQELEALQSGSASATGAGGAAFGQTVVSGVGANGSAAGGSSAPNGTLGSSGSSAATAATTGSCSPSSTGTDAAVQCAATAGNFPASITPAALDSALQKATGSGLAPFMANAAQLGPAGAIASGLGSLGTDPATSFGSKLASLAGDMNYSGVYTAGGGGSKGGTDPADAMKSLLEQFGAKKKDGDKTANSNAVSFANRSIASANPENDPSISLFARVASRYASISPRLLSQPMELQGGALPPLPISTK